MITHGNTLSFVQLSPLIDSSDVQEICSESNWATIIASYLKDGILPDEKEPARKLKVRAARFVLIKDVLYKRGFSRPHLRYGQEKPLLYKTSFIKTNRAAWTFSFLAASFLSGKTPSFK